MRALPPIRCMDAGTREGRRSMLAMVRRELTLARVAFENGNPGEALDALMHALRVKQGLARYYALRRAVLEDQRYNVCGPRPW
jgi:hypothetical protein